MPYPGVPKHLTAKVDRCVKELKRKKDVEDPYAVCIAAIKGKANKELTVFLSRLLRVSKSSVSIVKGYTSHNKVIAIAGLSQEDVMKRLSH